jgi:hypothetical protein
VDLRPLPLSPATNSAEATGAQAAHGGGSPPAALAALRRFVRPRPPAERCDLCATELSADHQHLFAPASREVACACQACAILFSGGNAGRYRLVPRRGEFWPDFQMSDADWEGLNIPINLAFFTESTAAGRVVAYYPSPAGAMESVLSVEAWERLRDANPPLRQLQPDVEALLVNRVGPAREYYRAPIDQCYHLVGLIRARWRGLSGGPEVWRAIAGFFSELRQKS